MHLDIKCVLGKRFMQVKNPWSHKRWRGPYSHLDTESWTPELMGALNYDPSVAGKKDDGIFWIDYESVCKHFASIHLNWNPETFSHRWVLHSYVLVIFACGCRCVLKGKVAHTNIFYCLDPGRKI